MIPSQLPCRWRRQRWRSAVSLQVPIGLAWLISSRRGYAAAKIALTVASGLYVRLYQLEYPNDVIGLVLLDPATENRLFIMFEQQLVLVAIGSLTAEQLRSTLPSRGSVPIPSRSPQTSPIFTETPRTAVRQEVRSLAYESLLCRPLDDRQQEKIGKQATSAFIRRSKPLCEFAENDP